MRWERETRVLKQWRYITVARYHRDRSAQELNAPYIIASSHTSSTHIIYSKYFANIDIDAYLFEYMHTNCKAFFSIFVLRPFLCIIPKSAPLKFRYARGCWDRTGDWLWQCGSGSGTGAGSVGSVCKWIRGIQDKYFSFLTVPTVILSTALQLQTNSTLKSRNGPINRILCYSSALKV